MYLLSNYLRHQVGVLSKIKEKCRSVCRKWRCSGKVSCLAVADDGKSIVTAKREIQWWDLSSEKENVVKTFIGHSTDVQSLVFARISGEACVLSAAVDNRLVSAW
jgi:WD40 repeat protein